MEKFIEQLTVNKIRLDLKTDLLAYFTQVVEIGEMLQKKKISYFCLKPKNILIFPKKVLKLIDFGLSKKVLLDAQQIADGNIDKLEEILQALSPFWTAPEILELQFDKSKKK